MSGALAGAGGHGGQLLVTLAYNAILARLITPHDFGLVAMAMVVAGFLQVFRDAGLSTATIREENISVAQVSNLFWLNVAVGSTAMLAMAATAPVVAWFFRQPELSAISLLLSLGFLLESLAVQHIAILNRQMRFTLLAGVDFGCATAGFGVGVVMAFTGWGYWSLVGTTLSTLSLRIAAAWTLLPWRPQRPVRGSGMRPLVRFGANLTLVGVLYALSRGCDSLLIGRFLGSDAVGLYSRATVLLTRPLERMMAPVYTVIVPALSRLQNEPSRYRTVFIHIFEGLAITTFFLTGLLFPSAGLLITVILGDKWDAAAPIFAALTFAAAYLLLGTATSWLFTSQGRGWDLLITACIVSVAMVGAFIAGLPFGVAGVAIAYSTSTLLVMLPAMFYMAGRTGPVTTRDLWLATIYHIPVFVTVLAATWLARSWLVSALTPIVQLVICLSAGSAAGLVTVWCSASSRRVVRAVWFHLNDFRKNRPGAQGVEVATNP